MPGGLLVEFSAVEGVRAKQEINVATYEVRGCAILCCRAREAKVHRATLVHFT
jgi:hypothetical protein